MAQHPLPLFPRLDISQLDHTAVMHSLPVPSVSLHASPSYPSIFIILYIILYYIII